MRKTIAQGHRWSIWQTELARHMQTLSPHLQHFLEEYGLCTRRDLRRCRTRVRRLVRDLPAFDSVWIDALVQAGRLTAFQAHVLESGQPQRLAVGPCLLEQRLGGHQRSTTYLARHRQTREPLVLKLIHVPDSQHSEVKSRLIQLKQSAEAIETSGIAAPRQVLSQGESLIALSRYIPGPTLRDLLIRRGRVAPEFVLGIGQQLLHALAAGESAGIVHGEVLLENCRLSPSAQLVLVDAGIRPALMPEFSIHALAETNNPERFDGLAPECIARLEPATSRSDLYALGCLLWQLLTGRPPYPTGDPLNKLMAHQTRQIERVTEYAPNAPSELADAIDCWTNPDPRQRPMSAAEALASWPCSARRARRLVRHYQQHCQRRVSLGHQSSTTTNQRGTWLKSGLVAALVLAGLAVGHPQARSYWKAKTATAMQTSAPATRDPGSGATDESLAGRNVLVEAASDSSQARPRQPVQLVEHSQPAGTSGETTALPAANADGIIRLEPGKRYAPRPLRSQRPLVIEVVDGPPAQLLIETRPLQITAPTVTVRNLHLVVLRNPRNESTLADTVGKRVPPTACLAISATNVRLTDCTFSGPSANLDQPAGPGSAADASSGERSPEQPDTSSRTAAVAWQPQASADDISTQLAMQRSFIHGELTGIAVYREFGMLSVGNLLHTGGGPLLKLPLPDQQRSIVRLNQVTMRESGPLCEWRAVSEELDTPLTGLCQLDLADCLLAPHHGRSLLRVTTTRDPRLVSQQLQVISRGSLLGENTPLLSTRQRRDIPPQATAEDQLQIDGLAYGRFSFTGQSLQTPSHSLLESFQGPRRSDNPLGVDLRQFNVPFSNPDE